ncbi:MAG: DUF5809 family protein, partial [Haloferacaceae archaeon]|nr:DUF5809 family protein [Haloferacaceae archaeon]
MMQHDCRGPVDAAAVRRGYASVVPTAKIVLAEVANGLSFDRSAYEEQIDAELVERVANVLFAAGLAVAVSIESDIARAREDVRALVGRDVS